MSGFGQYVVRKQSRSLPDETTAQCNNPPGPRSAESPRCLVERRACPRDGGPEIPGE